MPYNSVRPAGETQAVSSGCTMMSKLCTVAAMAGEYVEETLFGGDDNYIAVYADRQTDGKTGRQSEADTVYSLTLSRIDIRTTPCSSCCNLPV